MLLFLLHVVNYLCHPVLLSFAVWKIGVRQLLHLDMHSVVRLVVARVVVTRDDYGEMGIRGLGNVGVSMNKKRKTPRGQRIHGRKCQDG